MDIFSGWNDYVTRLENNWRKLVTDNDTVVIAGDISWAMKLEQTLVDFQFINSLPGKKIFLKGNHDYWWTSLTKMNAFLEENGFTGISFLQNDAVLAENKILCGSRGWICEEKMTEQDEKILSREAQRFALSLKKGAELCETIRQETGKSPEIVCFSHYPLLSASLRENPILALFREYGVKRVYYGHLHNWHNKPLFDRFEEIRLILVSSDYCNFTPQKIE